MLDSSPTLTIDDAARVARERYGRSGRARQLTSERDQNFLIDGANGDGAIVLKVANARENRLLLEAQHRVLARLGQEVIPTPRLVCTTDGNALTAVDGSGGHRHFVWAVTHLEGRLLADVRYRSPDLLEDLGRNIGRLSSALRYVDEPALDREFNWDLAAAPSRIGAARPAIGDRSLGATVDETLERVRRYVMPRTPALPRAPIHNDLNDHNILVAGNRVSGILDFGDMVYGWRIADLAIAAAYAMLDTEDPLAVLGALVRGAHGESALDDVELEVVYELACLRLALSAAIATEQQQARP
ncbi:MAG TPA: phosphotransferase, partial [Gemmatimonadaceae bacterium]|nr:phosphotransferase [Gemmatimonadaceae bacterium]